MARSSGQQLLLLRIVLLQLLDEDRGRSSSYETDTGFNYRAARLLYTAKNYNRLRDGSVMDTNDQVVVADGILWVSLYWRDNTRGLLPENIAAFVATLITNEEVRYMLMDRLRRFVSISTLVVCLATSWPGSCIATPGRHPNKNSTFNLRLIAWCFDM